MKTSELIIKLAEMIEAEGDHEVVIEAKDVEVFMVVTDVSGKYNPSDLSRYSGVAPRCYIHCREEE